MNLTSQKITPFLWFDSQAEEAARFYTSVFPDSRIGRISRYSEEGRQHHGKEPGSVMVIEFELAGLKFSALNGGPLYRFSEAVSLMVSCDTQAEIDHYWSPLSEGGEEGPCGWLKDRFGLSWQVVPTLLGDLLSGPDPAAIQRVTRAFMQMKKFDIAALKRAYDGAP